MWRPILEYVMLRTDVPSGTFGGSVSITAKEDWAETVFNVILGLANNAIEITKIAVRIAAKPYLVVHFIVMFDLASLSACND